MSWQRRLAELIAAGGALAAGCNSAGPRGVPCGNADPDPCICNRMDANSPQCVAETQCEANGGMWEFPPDVPSTPGLSGSCVNPHADAGLPPPPADAP